MKRRTVAIFFISFALVVSFSIKYSMNINNKETEVSTIEQKENNDNIVVEESVEVQIEQPTEKINDIKKSAKIELNPVLQNPELPTGCEITSLTTVLNYYGFDVYKEYMADNFLPQGEVGKTRPEDAFIGTPYDVHSCGCFSPVIEYTANMYLNSVSSELIAEDISGISLENLKLYISNDVPVIVWATIDMLESYRSIVWNINGEDVYWLANEHCLVLIGYNEGGYIVSDPLRGIYEYPKDVFEERYTELGNQAVVIGDKNVLQRLR